MASMQDGLNFTAPPVGKVLLLGCIAAASAFVVTILIVVLCVGCQRKGKTHNVSSEGSKHRLMDMGILRQSSKLRSISKSDTEMNKMNCNGKSRQLPHIPSGAGEDGEHTYSEVGRRSSSATGARTTDDALYAMVGRAGQTDTPAPPAVPANTPAPPDPDGEGAEGGGGLAEPEVSPTAAPPPPQETTSKAEYACVRKLRKADKAPQKRDSGTDMGEPPPAPPTRHAPPSHPAPPPPHHPHSAKLPRRNMEAYNLPTFPKEAVFMGNGEQYIWKPPEDEDLVLLQNKGLVPQLMGPHAMESIQPSAAMVAEMYSKVCKAGKKKQRASAGGGGGGGVGGPPPPPLLPPGPVGSPPGANLQGFRTLGRPTDHHRGGGDHRGGGGGDRDAGGFSVVVKPQTWANPQEGGRPLDEHCYESIGTSVGVHGVSVDEFGGFGLGLGLCDPAYENVDAGPWKRERPPNSCATLRPRRKKSQQPLQQQQPPPPPPCTAAAAAASGQQQQQQQLQLLPKALQLLPGDNLYESIGDLKAGQHSATSSTTTIFTFNDGMEMYVTGL